MLRHPAPYPTEPGQESVWDYPRPPRLEPTDRHVRVELGGIEIADTTDALRVLETSHPPTYYVPPADVRSGLLTPAGGGTICEWKGAATYWTVTAGDRRIEAGAWSYGSPTPSFAAIAHHVSFYPARFECYVDGHRVEPQPGTFYGGWVTPDVVGPFKGVPGSMWW